MAFGTKAGRVKDAQDWLPKIHVKGGMLVLDHGYGGRNYIKVMEVASIPFFTLPKEQQSQIADKFRSWIATTPVRWGMCVSSVETDMQELLRQVRQKQREETDPVVKEEMEAYIRFVKEEAKEKTFDRKCYLYFVYENREDLEAESEEEIAVHMQDLLEMYARSFAAMGIQVQLHQQDANLFLYDMLYRAFNNQSSLTHPVQERIQVMYRDASVLQKTEQPSVDDRNYFAPTYVDDTHEAYMAMDGTYYMQMYLMPISRPTLCPVGWMSDFLALRTAMDGNGEQEAKVSFAVHVERYPRAFTMNRMEQSLRITNSLVRQGGGAAEERSGRASALAYILDRMKAGEDLYKVYVVLSLSAKTIGELKKRKAEVKSTLKSMADLRLGICANHQREGFFMSLPIGYLDPSICALSENTFLTSGLSSCFCFTEASMQDPCGAFLGVDTGNKLVCFDPFASEMRNNANGFVEGTSGAGKTFAMNVLLRHLRLMGIRIRMILPIKGREDYLRATKTVNGEYVSLMPGSSACINLFEIRPQDEVDESELYGDYQRESLLAKKCKEIRNWMILRSRNTIREYEKDRLDAVIYEMYADAGIDDTNASIERFLSEGKAFPTFSDFDAYLARDPRLEEVRSSIQMFVKGRCKNLNGQTNVDLENKWVVFDVDKRICGDVLPEYYSIAMSLCSADAHRSHLEKVILFYDEVQEVIKVKEIAETVDEQYATLRGYGSGVWCATQEVTKLMTESALGKMSKTIMANSATKFLMRAETNEDIREICKMTTLSEYEKSILAGAPKGWGVLISGTFHCVLHIEASKKEMEAFNTDARKEEERLRQKERLGERRP
jgi:hypothetical protein